jgi:hypothetical protein
LETVADLTSIEPYSGWRNSGTVGEAGAIDYLVSRLSQMPFLLSQGLELERQGFRVYMATEIWDAKLKLTADGEEWQVPASALRGPRDEIAQALRFDSDGKLNDANHDPVVVEGSARVIRNRAEIGSLNAADLTHQVVVLDYALIDRSLLDIRPAVNVAWELISKAPAGLVLVTENSNELGKSHGAFVGDVSALNWVEAEPNPPTLHVRLEDLAPAGIHGWDDLRRIQRVELTWDADVFAPGQSSNLIARIPGADGSRAMILGAHVDSPNSPGAMDDGSGVAVLLEVARVIDAANITPPFDLYLAWFGSEELGLYGAAHFVNTHQELLDRTAGMLQLDCLTRPLDGIHAELSAITWSYSRLGVDGTPWTAFLVEQSALQGVQVVPEDIQTIYSDNSNLAGFGVPQADVIFVNEPVMEATGSLHYAAHIHDPYDTIELATEMGHVLEDMARVALVAALETGPEAADFRVAPSPEERIVFVGSHTESIHLGPTAFIDLGMSWAMLGFDVDIIPYGQLVTANDLTDAAMVVVLPVLDYPSPEGDLSLYDEAWDPAEIEALVTFVDCGGLMVITNSAHRLKYGNRVLDSNEDWADMNALSGRFGVTYQQPALRSATANLVWDHPIAVGRETLRLAENNGVPMDLNAGLVLAQTDGRPAAAWIEWGDSGGQVLVLADVGILGTDLGEPQNLFFWQNLARHARAR